MPDPCDELIGRLLETYHRLVARGQRPAPEDFRDEAGECYERFRAVLAQEQMLDHVLEGTPAERYPRTFGEYTLLELLGRGGIGNVYKAMHRPLARTVALKVLQGGWADDPELAERFRRGARAAAQVEHDHVVRIHDVGIFEGRPFIAMTYVPGTNLSAVFRQLRAETAGPFTSTHHAVLDRNRIPGEGDDTPAFVRRIAGLLTGPAEALAAYHACGVIHRDVKPANLLVDEAGRVVLTDFDLARRLETNFKTQSGGALGTPGYMSPEQWDPLVPEVDDRSDVYALGCVFYESVVRRPPFEADDPSRLMKRILSESVPDPASAVPDLPRDARRVLLQALERRREDRYPSAQAFADDLRALSRGAEVAARPVALPKRIGRWTWRRKWPLAVVATLLLFPALWLLRPAYLHFDPWPVAEIFVDGERIGTSPLSHRLRPGRHEIRMEQRGCEPRSGTIEVGAGKSLPVNWRLVVTDRNDPGFVAAVLRRAGVKVTTAAEHAPARFEGVIKLLFPRGAMRPSDLDTFTTQAKEAIAGELVVRRGEGTEIHVEPVSIERGLGQFPVSADLSAELAIGSRYEWGIRRGGKMLARTGFNIVAETGSGMAQRAVLRIEAEYPNAIGDRAELLRKVEMSMLQQQGLHVAAYRLAQQAGDGVAMSQALEDLGVGELDDK